MSDEETALPCVFVNGQRFNVLHERDEILIVRRPNGSKRYLAKRLGNAQIYGANRAQIVASSPKQAQAVMAAREKAQ